MQTFEKLSDLEHLSLTDPARSVIREILERLLQLTEQDGRSHQASIDGYVCLAEADDIGRSFNHPLAGYSYESVLWEAVHIHHVDDQTRFWVAAFVPNNSTCTLVLFPDKTWLPDSWRRVLCANMVPEA